MRLPPPIHHDPLPHHHLGRTRLPRISRLKDLVQLLQRPAPRLHEKEIDKHPLKTIPEDEKHIEPIPDVGQRDRRRERVDEAGRAGRQLEDGHAFGAHVVGHDFARVDGLHGRVPDGEDAAENVDEGDAGAAGFLAAGAHVAGGGAGRDGEADDHAGRRAQEHLAAADAVVQERAGGREDPAHDGVDDVEQEFGGGVGDADVFDERREVVGDHVVAAELAEPGEGHVEHEAVAPVAGFDHVA